MFIFCSGDEIQDWNEQSLVDCTFEEVAESINSSMEDNQDSNELHLIVCRDKYVSALLVYFSCGSCQTYMN